MMPRVRNSLVRKRFDGIRTDQKRRGRKGASHFAFHDPDGSRVASRESRIASCLTPLELRARWNVIMMMPPSFAMFQIGFFDCENPLSFWFLQSPITTPHHGNAQTVPVNKVAFLLPRHETCSMLESILDPPHHGGVCLCRTSVEAPILESFVGILSVDFVSRFHHAQPVGGH